MDDEDFAHYDRVYRVKSDINDRIVQNIRYGAKISAALDRVVVGLSGSALVFSMTFVDKLAPHKLWIPVLLLSWVAFVISILATTFGLRRLQKVLTRKANELDQLAVETSERLAKGELVTIRSGVDSAGLDVWNALAVWAFLGGIILLGTFVARNLLTS